MDADTRVHVFTADGRLVRSVNPPRPEGHRCPQHVGVMRDGSAVLVAAKGLATSNEQRSQVRLFRSSRGGDSLTPIFELPGYREVRIGQAPSRLLLDGEGTVTARETRICAGFSGQFDLTCYEASGTGVTRIIRETDARAPTDSERSVGRDAYLAANRDAPPRVREQMQKAFRNFASRIECQHSVAYTSVQSASCGSVSFIQALACRVPQPFRLQRARNAGASSRLTANGLLMSSFQPASLYTMQAATTSLECRSMPMTWSA